MRNRTKYYVSLFALAVALASCTDTGEELQTINNQASEGLAVRVESWKPKTRTDISFTTNYYHEGAGQMEVKWASTDKLGVYSATGVKPVSYEGTSPDNAALTRFSGSWGRKNGESFSVAYPYDAKQTDRTKVVLDYTGQTQDGVNSSAHLGKYNFMVSGAVTAEEGKTLEATLQQVSIPLAIRFTFSDQMSITGHKITKLILENDFRESKGFIVGQTWDLSGQEPVEIENERVYSHMLFLNVTGSPEAKNRFDELSNREMPITFYMMMPRQNLTKDNFGLKAHLEDEDGAWHEVPILVGKDLTDANNAAYRIVNNIEFKDLNVKKRILALTHWDKDEDGEISYEEAEQVKSLMIPTDIISDKYPQATTTNASVFNEAPNYSLYPWNADPNFEPIESFDELQYFIGLTAIDYNAFRACKMLSSISLPPTITKIGDGAFSETSSLKEIVIPEGVTTIGGNAFQGRSWASDYGLTSGLEKISLPSTLTSLGGMAFDECTNLKEIVLPDGITTFGQHTFRKCTSLTSVTLPEALLTLGQGAFRDCTNLTTVVLNDKLKTIVQEAFYNCTKLSNVTCPSLTPPTLGTYVFDNNAEGRIIKVPSASLESYKAATNWSQYASALQAM